METTREQRALTMEKMVNGIQDTIVNLKSRWLDEKEYEDFNEYKTLLTKKIMEVAPKDTKVIKISKSFVILLELAGFPYKPEIFCTTSALGWRQSKA